MRLPTRGPLVLIALVAVLAAGCGGSSSEDGSAAAPATTAAPTTTTPPTTQAPTSQPAGAADCDNATLLRAAQEAVGTSVNITSVTVVRCRNGYALVRARPDAENLESPNVFLVWREAAGSWEAVDVGTGIDCAGSPIGPELTAACEALGYYGRRHRTRPRRPPPAWAQVRSPMTHSHSSRR
jgi:hypothetical protein